MTQHFDRRRFIEQSLVAGCSATISALAPHGWLHAAAAMAKNQDRILVVIQLSGGNDGLNTVVPFRDEAYRKARPKLAMAADSVIKLTDELGLHASLTSITGSLDAGRFHIVQGVGYDKPNRSHFESMDIWHSCQRKSDRHEGGWLGRWMRSIQDASGVANGTLAMHLGHEQQPLALASRGVTVPSIASLSQFKLQIDDRDGLKQELMRLSDAKVNQDTNSAASDLLDFVSSSSQTALQASQRIEESTKTKLQGEAFPETALGEKLSIIAQLIVSELPTRVYYVTLDGFDTHAQQSAAHAGLLRTWSDALGAFHRCLTERGHADRVLVMTFSEFGRRLAENASDGTDHGAAAPLFLSGPVFKKTWSGEQPKLTDLDDGDIKYNVDFRRVYATILESWFGNAGSSPAILGGSYDPLEIV